VRARRLVLTESRPSVPSATELLNMATDLASQQALTLDDIRHFEMCLAELGGFCQRALRAAPSASTDSPVADLLRDWSEHAEELREISAALINSPSLSTAMHDLTYVQEPPRERAR
jgi:hypothetical protein